MHAGRGMRGMKGRGLKGAAEMVKESLLDLILGNF